MLLNNPYEKHRNNWVYIIIITVKMPRQTKWTEQAASPTPVYLMATTTLWPWTRPHQHNGIKEAQEEEEEDATVPSLQQSLILLRLLQYNEVSHV